jgi:5-(carboxyamino)imidazole ribonucleotide synthase
VPSATVGVLGGGQLGRMLALAGAPLGVACIGLEPTPDPPMAVAAEVIRAPYGDPGALAELADRCDVVTIEVEHVPVDALAWLADRVPVRPSPAVVSVTQDRWPEKQAFQRLGIDTAPFARPEDLSGGFDTGTIVKRRTGGFDGRGQVRLEAGAGAARLAEVVAELGGGCVVEGVVPFERELSVVAARGVDGAVACYPLVENRHRDGILRETLAPAPVAGSAATGSGRELAVGASEMVTRFMHDLDHVGVLALELFEVGGRLLANEVAPRVHNSGHWTIEGAVTSQFEQHLRAVLGWPLGDPSSAGAAGMVNLIGTEPDPAAVLAVPGAHLHRYGKTPRAGRKLGHVTVVALDEPERDARLARVGALIAVSASS